jgi:hypothetical protein
MNVVNITPTEFLEKRDFDIEIKNDLIFLYAVVGITDAAKKTHGFTEPSFSNELVIDTVIEVDTLIDTLRAFDLEYNKFQNRDFTAIEICTDHTDILTIPVLLELNGLSTDLKVAKTQIESDLSYLINEPIYNEFYMNSLKNYCRGFATAQV